MGIGYKSDYKRYSLTPRRKRFGKIVARASNTSKSIALAALKDPDALKWIVKGIGKRISYEIQSLCSYNIGSIHRSKQKGKLVNL